MLPFQNMGQPVKLSEDLVLEARVSGSLLDRSIAGQVEFWARLGRALEPLLLGDQVLALSKAGQARPLSALLATVDGPQGRQRVTDYLTAGPYPHFEPHPTRRGIIVRIEADGTRREGRFVKRRFEPVP